MTVIVNGKLMSQSIFKKESIKYTLCQIPVQLNVRSEDFTNQNNICCGVPLTKKRY